MKKLMIASDIHGSAYYCRKMKERFLEEGAEKLVLLGDLLYHGARNPLPKEYDTLKTAEILNSLKEKIVCVRGNCDSDVDGMVLEFPVRAEFALIPLDKGSMVLTHGHLQSAILRKDDVLVNGHFHVPAIERREDCLYVNCGSVSIPKEDSPHSYLIFEGGTLLLKDLLTGECFLEARL